MRSNEYDPFGMFRSASGQSNITMLYQGQQLDSESGNLYYMRARYYDPIIGRFISKDPIEGILGIPQTQNSYSYALNNPINLNDPSGEAVAQGVAACAALACKDGDCLNEARAVQSGATTVYQAVANGAPKYVGITNDFARRAGEHLREAGRVIEPLLTLPTREQARAVEQALIEKSGLNNLDNIRNSISPNNPIYQEAIKHGNEILHQLGL